MASPELCTKERSCSKEIRNPPKSQPDVRSDTTILGAGCSSECYTTQPSSCPQSGGEKACHKFVWPISGKAETCHRLAIVTSVDPETDTSATPVDPETDTSTTPMDPETDTSTTPGCTLTGGSEAAATRQGKDFC
eukprot:3069007-Pyramimonas_sp.AAC.1